MRRLIKLSLLAFVGLSTLVSCSNSKDNTCQNHIDLNGDGLCENCHQPVNPTPVPSKKNFEGITFADKSFDYDGNSHSIFVQGAPSIANVSYTGNDQKEPGEYTVVATITATDYNTLVLSVKMSIVDNLKHFEGLVFDDLTVNYDGKAHSIYVENVPSFAKVKYSGNDKTNVGTYTVKATISADGYRQKEMSAKLVIKELEFKGITFKDQTIPYDGYYHSIAVEGAPEFANVTYKNNNKMEVGSYTVTATISATGYKSLTLSAVMKIAKKLPTISTLVDRTLFYDGTEQLIYFEYPSNLPYYTQATFKVDGKTVEDKNDLRVKTVGTHTVSVTLTNEEYKYEATTTTATIKVIENNIGTTDSSKTAFKITNDLKYQTLRSEILKGNFTVKYEYYDDYYYPDSTEKHVLSNTRMIYVADGELFEFYSMVNKEDTSYHLPETTWTHAKIVGNDVLFATYEEGLLNESECLKIPESAYNENVVGEYGIICMSYLKEANDGGFENSSEGGYTTTYGEYTIDASKNTFRLDTKNHYYHAEWNHDEHSVYTIYNIGNTKINMNQLFSVENIEYSKFENGPYSINGFEYNFASDHVKAYTSFNAKDVAYLKPGTYILPAEVNGLPVLEFDTGYYDKYFDNDCSGYTFKAYFDENGYYQGEYSSFGKIDNFSKIDVFLNDGGNILYYGEW